MVKSEKIFSPQNFVEIITGYCYIFDNENTTLEIEDKLIDNGYDNLWNYPLSEIDEIVENNLNVVLVDVSGFNDDDEWITEYRWFEVPENFKED